MARDEFNLSKRLKREKKTVVLPPLERTAKKSCYAGRSEAFTVGYTPSVTYSDVKSLYPTSMMVTRALEIADAEPCATSDLVVDNDLCETRYGWLSGSFEGAELLSPFQIIERYDGRCPKCDKKLAAAPIEVYVRKIVQ